MPISGHVVDLVTAEVGVVREAVVAGAGQEVHWFRGSSPGRKRVRLNRKTPAHLVGLVVQSRPRVWKRLCQWGIQVFLFLITRGGVVIRMMVNTFLLRSGLWWVSSLGLCLPTYTHSQ